MRAVVCHEFGPPERLVVEEVADPVPGPGEVLVAIQAAGLNFTDVLSTAGRSQLARALPMVPGVEAAGVVEQVGPGVTTVAPGQRVLGHTLTGGLAERGVFAAQDVATIPDEMDMPTAAAFYIAAKTSDYALVERARLQAGETLLVIGAGSGAGMAAVQIGKAIGAKVVAAASSDDKLDLARRAGADAVVRYPREALDRAAQKRLTADLLSHAARPRHDSIGAISSVHDDAGYHVIYDAVGGDYAEPALRALGWQGRYLSVGFSAGVPKIALGPILFKNATLMGIQPADAIDRSPGLARNAMTRMFDWWRAGRLVPHISETYPIEETPRALARLANRQATGRIVIDMRL